ncbi:MAG: LacI family DNA-binding transcriptional regulator [Spirochaetales bacterium]|nr:LacI family DNA-binding transcriptional regulator [Spirochaetales bacterium]
MYYHYITLIIDYFQYFIIIIAQDNTILSRLSHPALTTVDMEISRLGIESAEMMLQLLGTENPMPRRLIFYPGLIKRESCGPAPE